MPLYTYRCPDKHLTDAVRTVEHRAETPVCDKCGKPTEKIITPTHVAPQFQSYKAVAGDQRWVHSRNEHKDFLSENSLEEIGSDKMPEKFR